MNEFVIVFSKVVLRLGKTATLQRVTDVALVGSGSYPQPSEDLEVTISKVFF